MVEWGHAENGPPSPVYSNWAKPELMRSLGKVNQIDKIRGAGAIILQKRKAQKTFLSSIDIIVAAVVYILSREENRSRSIAASSYNRRLQRRRVLDCSICVCLSVCEPQRVQVSVCVWSHSGGAGGMAGL